jgi:hypothetical protein
MNANQQESPGSSRGEDVKGRVLFPNPSVRPSWRRLATQRRTEPSEFSIFWQLSAPDRLTTATWEAVERRSAAVLSQKALCKSVDKMLLRV